jgi:hypothetical protein
MTAPSPRMNDVAGLTLAGRLQRERQAVRARSLSVIALCAIAAVLVVLATGAWILAGTRWLTLPRALPVLVWLAGAALAAVAARSLRRRNRDSETTTAIAAAVEGEQGLRAGSLRGALEVASTGVFGAFAAQSMAARLPQTQSLVPSVRSRLTKHLAIAATLAVTAVALVVIASRFARDGLAAVAHPVSAWRGLLLPPLGFPGVPAMVPRGMPLTVRVAAPGRQTVVISMRAPGQAWSDTTIDIDAKTGEAKLSLGPVRAPIALRASDGRAPVAEIVLNVGDRGWVGDVVLRATYPAYLSRNSETIEAVSPLRVPRGTQLLVTAGLHGGARNAALTNGKDTVRFTGPADSLQVQARFTADHDGSWHWIADASRSTANSAANGASMPPELPEDFALVVAPDIVPQVSILSPAGDSAIGTSGTLPLSMSASDDHGIQRVMVSVWREAAVDVGTPRAASGKREQLMVAEPGSPIWSGEGGLALAGRSLEPGDRLHIVALAIDNSPWRQEGRSAELVLHVPSLSDQRTMARALGDSLAAQAQRLATAEKKLAQSTTDASRQRDLKTSGSSGGESGGDNKTEGSKAKEGTMSFSSAERAKQVSRDQQQLSAKLDSMRANAKELEQRLRDAGALDSALANRMRDVQKMLRDAMTPEMQKQLQNLDNATERLSGTDAQKSMEQLAAQQQQMREQLEKSAEMLKRAAMEGTMETLRDEANDLARAQQQLAQKQKQKQTPASIDRDKATSAMDNGRKTTTDQSSGDRSASRQPSGGENAKLDPKELAQRTKDLQKEVDALAKKLEQAGAKPGAQHARDAEPLLDQAAEAMQRAAKNQQGGNDEQKSPQNGDAKSGDQKQGQQGNSGKQDGQKQDGQKQSGQQSGAQQGGQQPGGQQQGGQQQGGQQQGGKQGAGQQSGGQQSGGQPGSDAQKASDAMDRAADQLAQARQSQVDAWKNELSSTLDQSINETMQLAKQQASLEQRARQQGAASPGMQSEQGAIQQGVQQAAQRLEQAGRSSSLLSQRSQKAMADAQKRSQQATQSVGQAGTPGGEEAAQNAMKDATESLNQALSALVRDRERVNSAQSASGFTEMMEQLKELAKQQGSLNGQMQGLNMLPGGAQGQQAQSQARTLAKQQRDVARSLQDVSDADATGRTDALAKEAQQLAQSMERQAPDPAIAARQQQLYRRLLDAGRFMEQDERDDQGPREAKAANGTLTHAPVDGVQSGKGANKFAAPTWNDLRGLGAEERRLVLEYFRRLNGKP